LGVADGEFPAWLVEMGLGTTKHMRQLKSAMIPMELTHKDVTNLIEMIDRSEHLEEVEVVFGGFRLHVQRSKSGRPLPPQPSAGKVSPDRASVEKAPSTASTELSLAAGEIAVHAPMLGTFYRAPAPGEKCFVEVGQSVRADDIVCLIEVMKLLSSITAGVDGTVTRILIQNGQLVEFGQALIVIAKSN
jgi:acetyl-CoA carboxylase biotin carboxyl carrier protein